MDRTSRTAKELVNKPLGKKTYTAGIYARLSVDSHNAKNESIETQIEIAKNFLNGQTDMVLFQCYIDLGKTGTNFNRDGFHRLMQDVRMKNIDCIIVKDFSRLGRNYIEMGNYLEKIFPFLGVRFISVTDNFDSLEVGKDSGQLGMSLKNLVNELYARDIGIKIKASKQARWEQGSYIGGIPPYGYYAQWIAGKKCLLIEEITGDIVRGIYHLYLEGKNRKEIGVWLYENNIHRPKDYRKYGHIFSEEEEILQEWSDGTIKTILSNPVYRGCLVQCKIRESRQRKRHDVSNDDWSVKEGTHEAIVSKAMFCKVAERFERQAIYCNRDGFSKAIPLEEDLFRGLLFCGECGKGMVRTSSVKEFASGDKIRNFSYYCRSSNRVDEFACGNKYVTLETLSGLVKVAIKHELWLVEMNPGRVMERIRAEAGNLCRKMKKEEEHDKGKMESLKRKASDQYKKYRMREISQSDFLEWKQHYNEKMKVLEERQAEWNQSIKEQNAAARQKVQWVQSLLEFHENSKLDRDILDALIQRIDVYSDKRIEIHLRFTFGGGLRVGREDRPYGS